MILSFKFISRNIIISVIVSLFKLNFICSLMKTLNAKQNTKNNMLLD